MSLTSDGRRMLAWAEKGKNQQITERIFPGFEPFAESYYEKIVENENLVYEYGFETFAELKKQLDKMWQEEMIMEEAALISAVAAMKNKPLEENMSQSAAVSGCQEGEFEIPEYVYVF